MFRNLFNIICSSRMWSLTPCGLGGFYEIGPLRKDKKREENNVKVNKRIEWPLNDRPICHRTTYH